MLVFLYFQPYGVIFTQNVWWYKINVLPLQKKEAEILRKKYE